MRHQVFKMSLPSRLTFKNIRPFTCLWISHTVLFTDDHLSRYDGNPAFVAPPFLNKWSTVFTNFSSTHKSCQLEFDSCISQQSFMSHPLLTHGSYPASFQYKTDPYSGTSRFIHHPPGFTIHSLANWKSQFRVSYSTSLIDSSSCPFLTRKMRWERKAPDVNSITATWFYQKIKVEIEKKKVMAYLILLGKY